MPGTPSDKQPIRDINTTAAQVLALCWAVCLAQNYIAWKEKREGDVGTFDASFLLIIVGALVMVWRCTQSDSSLRKLLRRLGVARSRLRKAVSEIERKTFHLTGLGVPFTLNATLVWGAAYGLGESVADRKLSYCRFAWTTTAVIWCCDILRLMFPRVAQRMPLTKILREHEQTQLTGTCWFSLGSSLCISYFEAPLATAALLMLIVGDMAAALVGVAFGGEAVVIKLGRHGKKSFEGSAAMFLVCCVLGTFVLSSSGVPLPEYVAGMGALVATIVELYTDDVLGLDDNITIPLASAAAMAYARERVSLL